MRALVIEDDLSVARILRRYLSALGWDVDEAHSLSEARELFNRGRYDLAVSDVNLPDGDGILLAGTMRAARPALRVILNSGDATNRARAKKAGFRHFLDKPFTAGELDAALDSFGRRRILIVEDDLVQLTEYTRTLEAAEYWTVAVDNAEAAVILAEKTRFDAILTDNVLPGMTGLQALVHFRKSGSPVVVMSSHFGPESVKDALLLGASRFLKKPIAPPELCRTIRQACAESDRLHK